MKTKTCNLRPGQLVLDTVAFAAGRRVISVTPGMAPGKFVVVLSGNDGREDAFSGVYDFNHYWSVLL